mmetsp:Transcript_42909/g.50321  ORF Transcript_42909/g.50321 Transcript_42909/m.50321 type:complete len:356 (+) Transcript_42909:34-1101(+)
MESNEELTLYQVSSKLEKAVYKATKAPIEELKANIKKLKIDSFKSICKEYKRLLEEAYTEAKSSKLPSKLKDYISRKQFKSIIKDNLETYFELLIDEEILQKINRKVDQFKHKLNLAVIEKDREDEYEDIYKEEVSKREYVFLTRHKHEIFCNFEELWEQKIEEEKNVTIENRDNQSDLSKTVIFESIKEYIDFSLPPSALSIPLHTILSQVLYFLNDPKLSSYLFTSPAFPPLYSLLISCQPSLPPGASSLLSSALSSLSPFLSSFSPAPSSPLDCDIHSRHIWAYILLSLARASPQRFCAVARDLCRRFLDAQLGEGVGGRLVLAFDLAAVEEQGMERRWSEEAKELLAEGLK